MARSKSVDEFEGQGGSFIVDPKSGKRVLKERTDERKQESQPEPANDDILKGDK